MRSNQHLELEQLENGFIPGVTREWGMWFAQAVVVCLASRRHVTGVILKVSGDVAANFSVYWPHQITEQMRDSWADDQELTEYAACGVAVVLILQLTEYTVIRRSKKGTGVDYWLGRQESDPPFQDAARLEISGILDGTELDIRNRVAAKRRQTEASSGALPAYVVVVEFGKPQARVVKT